MDQGKIYFVGGKATRTPFRNWPIFFRWEQQPWFQVDDQVFSVFPPNNDNTTYKAKIIEVGEGVSNVNCQLALPLEP